jgi:hypothetical protein
MLLYLPGTVSKNNIEQWYSYVRNFSANLIILRLSLIDSVPMFSFESMATGLTITLRSTDMLGRILVAAALVSFSFEAMAVSLIMKIKIH